MSAAPTLREWLREEPFALAMSSGFFGFFAHTGVLRVLEDEGLVPARAAGSSAGALVTGAWASGRLSTELEAELLALRRADFWDPAPGPGLLRGALFKARLERLLGARTFEECRVPLALSVFDAGTRTTHVLARGALAPAIQASCTVPFLFHPVRHEGRTLLDGGIADRPGIPGLARGERVFYHHLSSRSPWRRFAPRTMDVPERPNLVAFVIEGLPRSGPFRLENGHRALHAARDAMQAALGRYVANGAVTAG